MNKQKFIKLLRNYHNIPDDERNKLHDLVRNYPYSQVLHILIAKANHDAGSEMASHTLSYAAMYTADRGVLKDIIKSKEETSPSTTEIAPSWQEVIKKDVAPPAINESEPPVLDEEASDPDVSHMSSDHVRQEIWLDLEALKKSKASYLEWAEEDEATEEGKRKVSDETASTTESKHTKKKAATKEKKKEKPASKPVALKADSEKSGEPKKKPIKKTSPEKKDKKKTDGKKSNAAKLKKKPQEEQKKIIEKFISKEPRITAKPLKSSDNQPDLSESSTSFNEELISENLAQILIGQGKKDKAIDIYKKLIWKFPQKKSYFASQIEELQNKK